MKSIRWLIFSIFFIPIFSNVASAGESVWSAPGGGNWYQYTGTVKTIYCRAPLGSNDTIFFVQMDDGTNSPVWLWFKANRWMLSTLLSQKNSGTMNTTVRYILNTGNTRADGGCWDMPWEGWVCRQLQLILGN